MHQTKGNALPPRREAKESSLPKPCQRFGTIKNELAFFPGLIKSRKDAPATVSPRKHGGDPGHALARPSLN